MRIINLIGAVLILLGVIYAILGFIALSHIDQSKNTQNVRMISPTWYAQSDIFDELGKRLCVIGKPLFYIVWIGLLAWFVAREFLM